MSFVADFDMCFLFMISHIYRNAITTVFVCLLQHETNFSEKTAVENPYILTNWLLMNCIFYVFIVANDICAVLLPMIFHNLIKKRIQSNYRRVNGSHLNGFRLKREYFSLSFLSYFSFLWVFLFVIWGPAHSLKSVSNVFRVMKWYPPREMTSANATQNWRKFN